MIKKSYASDIINNNFCICQNKLKQKINFGNLPLINNYKRKINLTKYPVIVSQCEKCLLIQLKYSIRDELLFPSDYSYLSSNSKEKINNFRTIFKKISKFSKKKNPQILYIGSNDGALLNIVKKKYSNILGIEPTNSADIAKKNGIKTIKKSLNLELAKKLLDKYLKFDFILATNILAQTNNLREILKSIKLLMDKKGILIAEVQYLYDLLEQKGFDSFHPEHIQYYTLSSITKILEKFGLYVYDAERLSVHGGILRIYASPNRKKLNKKLKKILKKENDKRILNKIKNLNFFKKKFSIKIKKFLKNLKKQKKIIYGVGAAPRSCVLLNSANITNYEIDLIGEVPQSLKCNKYVPGTNIMVKNENKIITEKPDYLFILAWHLEKQIIKLFLKKGYKGYFITPLPKLKIFKKKK